MNFNTEFKSLTRGYLIQSDMNRYLLNNLGKTTHKMVEVIHLLGH